MSKVYTDNIEKRTGGTAMAVPATGKWPTANIADDAITATQIAADAVGSSEIASDAVTTTELADNAVVNTSVAAAAAIAVDKLETGTRGDTLFWAADTQASRLAAGTSGYFLKTLGSGADPVWASAGGDNTPSFSVTIAASQNFADGTWTKVEWDTEVWDTNSAFDSSTNYRFTVPAGEGGKYVFHYAAGFDNIDDGETFDMRLYKNGSGESRSNFRKFSPGSQRPIYGSGSYVMSLVATDYVEAWCEQGEGATIAIQTQWAYFAGFKLIGV